MGILHDCKSCWPPMGPLRYPRGAQKGPFGLKQTLTGRKAPERPMTPQECPKQHKTLCLVGLYCYSTFSHTSRSFGDSLGTQWGLIWPQNSIFWPSEGPTVVRDLKKYFKKFVRGLYFNQFFHSEYASKVDCYLPPITS